MRESEDILIRDQLASTASAINCRYGTMLDQPTTISSADVDIVVQTLANNDAEYLLNQIGGEDKFGKLCAEVKFSLIDLETEVALS